MDRINVIKTQKMWKDFPYTGKWLEAIQNPTLHGFTGAPDSDYVKAVESLSFILHGDECPMQYCSRAENMAENNEKDNTD